MKLERTDAGGDCGARHGDTLVSRTHEGGDLSTEPGELFRIEIGRERASENAGAKFENNPLLLAACLCGTGHDKRSRLYRWRLRKFQRKPLSKTRTAIAGGGVLR